MRYRLLLPILPLLALFILPGDGGAQSTIGLSYIKVAPYEGHPGSQFYVTGGGFGANVLEDITTACPSIVPVPGGTGPQLVPGPTTDKHGRFIGFPILTISPNFPTPKAPVVCTVYASVGTNPFGPDITAKYVIVPPGQKLDVCAARICGVHVKVRPVRARTGQYVKIAVTDSFWPGAQAAVRLQYPSGRPQFRSLRLNYNGSASTRWAINVHLNAKSPSLKVRVAVRLQLGAIGGNGQQVFTVVH